MAYSGKAWYGESCSMARRLRNAGIERRCFRQEGLALSNGIDFMAACGAVGVDEAGIFNRAGWAALSGSADEVVCGV